MDRTEVQTESNARKEGCSREEVSSRHQNRRRQQGRNWICWKGLSRGRELTSHKESEEKGEHRERKIRGERLW